ncbi:hypothetical protein DH2020_028145 [Rehmannia glutinosa]|uniref:Uncharacterized protein n=1 Tax=Rehmannia glutinosa TaxID=99300 RepID=A0ABR0VUY2_REHGL
MFLTVVGHVDSVEERSASEKQSDKGSKITSPDALVSQRCRPDEAASGDLQDPRQPLVHSEQTVALPQVQQDKVDQSLVSAELQDLDEQAVENQSTLHIEIELVDTVDPVPCNLEATTEVELVDTVSPVPSNLEATVTDETVTPVLSNHEPPVTENSEQLHSGSLDESLNRNQSPSIEDHDEGRSSSQSAEPGGAEVPSHESISQSGENLEIHHNHLNTVPNDVATPQAVVSTAERPHQAVLQLGIDAGHLEGPSYLLHPTRQSTSWSSPPSLLADPLQNELERIRREREQLEKAHKDMMSQLRTDCEREIQEIIAQIRKRYEVKLQETEAEFRLKRNELDQNQNKVAMNKILAEVFRSKCKDPTPSGTPCVQQAVPSSFVQHMHQLSMPPPSTRPPVASACQPAPTQQQITPPAVQTVHQLPRPHSVRPPTITTQNVAAPPVQAVQHAAALFSGTSSRPPLISAITPVRNSRVGGEIRAPAPHLQSFRPAVASSPAVSQLRPLQRLPSQPIQTPLPPGPPPVALTNLVVPAPPNPSLPTVGLVPENRISTALPEICSTFHSLELADLEVLGNVEGNQTSTVASSDVVCLSDDE